MENDGRNEKGQFIKGRVETAEQKLIRSRSLSEAWINRDDYIKDIKLESPKIYKTIKQIKEARTNNDC